MQRIGVGFLAMALLVWLTPSRPASADDLSSASYRTTLVTSAGSGSTVDATNATIDSANYRNLFVAAQPTSTTSQQHTSASYRDSLGRIYLVWGLGTRYTEWIGTSDAGVETSNVWANAFNWGFGVPTASWPVLVPAARAYAVLGANGVGLSLTTTNSLTAVPNPSVTNSAAWSLTLSGDVTIGASTTLNWTGSTGSINLTGDWTNAGTFTPGSSTVTFNGAGVQNIQGVPVSESFYNLTMAKSASTLRFARGASATLTISNDLSIQSGLQFYVNDAATTGDVINVGRDLLISGPELQFNGNPGTISVTRDVVMTAGTLTMNTASDALNVGRNWNSSAGGTFAAGLGTGDVYFSGAAAQTISMAAGQTFPTLRIANSGGLTVTALSNVGVGDDLYITDGVYVVGGFTTTVADRLVGQGLPIAGTLRMNNTADILDVNGNFDWQGDAVEDVSAGTLTVAGNFTLTAAASNFTPTGGTVILDGATVGVLTNAGTLSFYDLTISKTGGPGVDKVTTTSDFSVQRYMIDDNTGDFRASASSRITFDGASDGKIWETSTGKIYFWWLTINKTNATVTTRYTSAANDGSLRVNGTGAGALTIGDGAGATSHLVVAGNTSSIVLAGGGTVSVLVDGILTVGNGQGSLGAQAGTVNYIYNAQMAVEGTVQGFPVGAIDLQVGGLYAIYVGCRDVPGTGGQDRVWVLNATGGVAYSWNLPATDGGGNATGDIVGRVRYYTEQDIDDQNGVGGTTDFVHTAYVGTTKGKLYKLYDSGSALQLYVDNNGATNGSNWTTNPASVDTPASDPDMAVTSSMQSDGVYVYFGGKNAAGMPGVFAWTMTSGSTRVFAQTGASLDVETDPSISTVSSVKYVFLGSKSNGANGSIGRVNMQTPTATVPPAASTPSAMEVSWLVGNVHVVAPVVERTGFVMVADTNYGADPNTNAANGVLHRLVANGAWLVEDTGYPIALTGGVRGAAFAWTGPERWYIGTESGLLYVRLSNGTTWSSFPVGGYNMDGAGTPVRVMPVIRSPNVYVGNQGGKVMAMADADLGDGTPITVYTVNLGSWNKITTVAYAPSPAARMIVGTSTGGVYFLPTTPANW